MEKSARPRTALNECVKVVVRCRPLSDREKNEGFDEVSRGRLTLLLIGARVRRPGASTATPAVAGNQPNHGNL